MVIFTPINQVKLTNVAVVRLKRYGIRFEVACYKNKVLNWRAGIESDIDEVLQIRNVFNNVSKGKYSKKEDLLKAFKTEDVEKVCVIILKEGELQVSEGERNAGLSAIFKDVVTTVAELTVNPQTGLTHTRGIVEGVIKEIGYSLKFDEPAKKQALKIIDLLQSSRPDQFARALMRLRATVKASQRFRLEDFLSKQCSVYFEKSSETVDNVALKQQEKCVKVSGGETAVSGDLNGHSYDDPYPLSSVSLPPSTPASSPSPPPSSSHHITPPSMGVYTSNQGSSESPFDPSTPSSSSSSSVPSENIRRSDVYVVVFLSSPNFFRSIENFLLSELSPSGSLELLSSNVKAPSQSLVLCADSLSQQSSSLHSKREPGNTQSRRGDFSRCTHVKGKGNLEEAESTKGENQRESILGSEASNSVAYSVGSVEEHEKLQEASRLREKMVRRGVSTVTSAAYPLQSEDDRIPSSNRGGIGGVNERGGISHTPAFSNSGGGASLPPSGRKGFMSCSVCGVTTHFESSSEYRAHCRSEWHCFNLKRKMQQLPPLSEIDYKEYLLFDGNFGEVNQR